jgi:hypothetical protein
MNAPTKHNASKLARAGLPAMAVGMLILALALLSQPSANAWQPSQPSSAECLQTETDRDVKVDYCARFPRRCGIAAPCPPITTDPATGKISGGCWPAEWVCCGSGGCVAIMLAGDCPGGSDLYWLDCEAGESAIDPATGEAVVLCHD